MANESAKIDDNYARSLTAVTDDVNEEIRKVRINPATNGVLVSIVGGSTNSFGTVNTDSGNISANASPDTMTLTGGSGISTSGVDATNTITIDLNINELSVAPAVDLVNDKIPMYDASTGLNTYVAPQNIAPDEVQSYANFAAFPVTGVVATIYVAEDTDNMYVWDGSAYKITGLQYFTEARSIAAPNATIPAHSFTATGAETNIDAVFKPKGTGSVLAQIPDNATAGGDKRGTNSVDLQTSRTASTQVASGTTSGVLSGAQNKADNTYSVVCGGVANNSRGTASFVGGGNSNNNTGDYATISGGNGNSTSGIASTVVGGQSNTTSGNYSVAGGLNAIDRGITRRRVFSGGTFSTTGDAQFAETPCRKSTTDATTSIMTSDGNAASTTNTNVLPNNSAYTVVAYVTARSTGGNAKSWKLEALVKRGANAAATSIVGTSISTVIAFDSGASTWTADIVANTTNGSAEISVVGQAATTIRWMARMDTIEVI